eukprot:240661_1
MEIDSESPVQTKRGRRPKRKRTTNGQYSSSSSSANTIAPSEEPTKSPTPTFSPQNIIDLDDIIFQQSSNPPIDIQSNVCTYLSTKDQFPYEIIDPNIENKAYNDACDEFHRNHKNCFKHGGHPNKICFRKKQTEIFDFIQYNCSYCTQYLLPEKRSATKPVVINGELCNDLQLRWSMASEQEVTFIEPEVTFIEPEITFIEPEVTFIEPEVTFIEPEITFIEPEV